MPTPAAAATSRIVIPANPSRDSTSTAALVSLSTVSACLPLSRRLVASTALDSPSDMCPDSIRR
ncbi:hypothetical protein B7C42_08389 [Nocardia cerradoensis]|uniref:Uncharacterized protein n=1 Tax=Nocardia cerradoensis TaxID=85688 RepID=A0A231GSD8_9NOCA|nr:hypothetical protein B7C42_08389 [Nocardia cerradoensis]